MAEKPSKGKSDFLGRVKSLKSKSKSKGDELSDKEGASPTRTRSVSSGGGGGQKVYTSKKKGASVSATDLKSNTVSVQKKQPQVMETSLTSSPGRQGTAASPPVRSNTLSSGGSTHSKSQPTVGPRSPANQSHYTSGENGSPLRTESAPTYSQATASRSSHPSASDLLAAHTPTCDDPQKDGGPMQAAAQMSNEEKIQRLQSTISNYEKLQKDLKSKIMELEKHLQKEEEKSRRPGGTMAHTPGAAVEELKQDPEVDHQEDRRSMKDGKFEGANHSTESTALQEQIADLRQNLEQKNREIDEKAHAIAEKENELTEIKERLEEQETKREESQHKFELMEKRMKKVAVEGTSPKASQELETYFEQLISLTQEFSELKIQSKEQEKELKNLRKIEERAKELEEGNLQAATELSQREEEMKQLHEVAIQQHTAVEPSREVKKLERKVKELQEKLEERQKEIQALKKGETPFVDPLGASVPVLSSVKDVTTLRIKVQEQQKEINNLRMQVGSVTPALREKEQLSKERERLQREREELEKGKKILVDHTEKQSQVVLALRRQLEASQKSESIIPEEQASQVKEELERAKAQLQQFEKERDDRREEYAKLQSLYEISKSQAEHVSELAKQFGRLKETATHMKSENDELKEMNELLKIEADQYKKDFDEERRDRESVMHRLGEDRDTTVGDVHTASEEYKRLREESRLKDEFLVEAQMEIDDMKKEIGEKKRLEEELKAKAAHVKQYQKQIDAMQNQLSAAQKYKVASKSEGPQHQQEEQLDKVQIEIVHYKSKLEQVEEELFMLQQDISSKDQQHQEKIDAMTSELQRLHQEKRAVEQQLETMQSRQHQLVQASNRQLMDVAYSESVLGCRQIEMQVDSALDQLDGLLQQKEVLVQELYNQGIQIPFQESKVSHKYLAEAQLQREGMASQLRGQQQQQQQRREGEPAPEQFRAAYSQLVFKCQELERQLDSALDQLDGLSQQKEVLVQELHNHSIPIPYEESKEAGPTYEVQKKVEGLVEKTMKVEEDVRSVKGEGEEMEGRLSGRLKEMEGDLKDIKSLLKDLIKAKQDTKE